MAIDHHGALVLKSHDLPGPMLRPFTGGAREYEFWTEVPSEAKDQRAVEEFRDWCKARGIAHKFVVWGGDYD